MTQSRNSAHHAKAHQQERDYAVATTRAAAAAAGRTLYREEYQHDYGPDLDESLDGIEFGSAFGAPTMQSARTKMDKDPFTVDVAREFHRRIATVIDAVQTGIWQEGVHDLLGYATDYGFGDKRGRQTLVLKSAHRSAYVRLQWGNVIGDTDADRQLVQEAIKSAINELR